MSQPLAFEIIKQNEALALPKAEYCALIDILSWRTKPFFPRRGRMAWHVFQQPMRSNFPDGRLYRAVKIKGVGAYNPPEDGNQHRDPLFDSYSVEPTQPTTQPLESFVTYPHLGVKEDGSFSIAYGSMAPVGGIVLDRALCEHEKAEHLCAYGVPSIAPFLTAQYTDLTFRDQPMGVVLTLIPDAAPFRLSELQFGAAIRPGEDPARDDYCLRVQTALGIEGDLTDEVTRLQAVCAISRKMGASIRQLSACGLYRYSADLNNFDFDCDTGDVVLTDLDSTQYLNALSPKAQHLQVMRDMASLTYRIVGKFYTPTALGFYNIDNMLRYDVIAAAIEGYFPEADSAEIQRASATLWRFFLPHFDLLTRWRNPICKGEWSSERRRSYKMDHHLFTIAAMILLFDLFRNSSLGARYASTGVDRASLEAAADVFLGERSAYLRSILS